MSLVPESVAPRPDLLPRQKPGLDRNHLLRRLAEKPWEFDFFQAVHLLGMFQEDVVEPGAQGPPGREAARFRARNHLGFAASQIQEIETGANPSADEAGSASGPPEMVVNFLGLQGPSGVLPEHYTILIQRLERDKDNPERAAFRAWLDLFNHRLVSFFYRTWTKYRPGVAFVSGFCRRPGGHDQLTEAMLAVAGKGMLPARGLVGSPPDDDPAHDLQRPGCPPLPPFDDRFLIIHGASLGRRVRTAGGLRSLLADYLGAPVEVEQFLPAWTFMDEETQVCLSVPRARERSRAGFGGLGQGATLGRRFLDRQGRVRLRIGPLDKGSFRQFIPAARRGAQAVAPPLHRIVGDLTRLYLPAGLGFDIRVVAAAGAVPSPVLGSDTPVLGVSVWLRSRDCEGPADDTVLAGD